MRNKWYCEVFGILLKDACLPEKSKSVSIEVPGKLFINTELTVTISTARTNYCRSLLIRRIAADVWQGGGIVCAT